eukprot:362268-Chlamydomonas_euryale.AAC.4
MFYKEVLGDDALSPIFEGINTGRQPVNQIAFMTAAWGYGNAAAGGAPWPRRTPSSSRSAA